MAIKIEMFSDFICPFCYIGFETVRKLKPEFDLDIAWRGFQIHPDWPAEGMPAAEFRREMSPETRRAIWTRIQAMAEEVGFSMKPPELLTNSRPALEAAEFAAEKRQGRGVRGARLPRVLQRRAEYRSAGSSRRPRRRCRDRSRRTGRRYRVEPLRDADQKQRDDRAQSQRRRCPHLFYRGVPAGRCAEQDVMRQILDRYVRKLQAAAK